MKEGEEVNRDVLGVVKRWVQSCQCGGKRVGRRYVGREGGGAWVKGGGGDIWFYTTEQLEEEFING